MERVIWMLQLNAVTVGGGPSTANSQAPLASTSLMASVVKRMQQPSYSDSEGRRSARHIDQLSRRLFPAIFIAFNVIYWSVYGAVENPV